MSTENSWLFVQGLVDAELQRELRSAVEAKIAGGAFTADFVKVVAKMQPGVLKGSLQASDVQLEALRRLCQIWDVDLKPAPITSHRKFIGPIIVAVKRLVFPILKNFMRDTLRQQRDFNAQTISLLMQLCHDRARQNQ